MATSAPVTASSAKLVGGAMPAALRISLALDMLRGIAAIFMVGNHVGALLVRNPVLSTPLSAFVFFVSSAAPVLFFFATGFAGALRPAGGGWAGRLRTVLCLEIADVLFAFGRHVVWYLDFFGFIALSALVVDALAGRRHGALWAAVVAVALLAVRYAIAPWLVNITADLPLLAWLLGFPATPDASYPLSPWLCFPLAGFALGRWSVRKCAAQSVRGTETKRPGDVQIGLMQRLSSTAAWQTPALLLVVTTAASSAFAFWAARQGHSINRWSEMDVGYLVASVGIVGVAIGLALAVTALPASVRRAVSLRGIAAYAVVPLHYAFITVLSALGLQPAPDAPYLAWAVLLAVLSLALARRFADGMRVLVDWRGLRPLAGIVVAACAALTWLVAANSTAALVLVFVGQMALAAWLLPAARPPSPLMSRV